MGDRTNLQVFIYDCPSARVRAVLDIIDEYQLQLDWLGAADDDRIHLGRVYGSHSACGEDSRDIASALIATAPEVCFDTWTDPAYDWLGAGTRYTPELGRFDYESDAEGNAVFSADEIAGALASGGVDGVRRILGQSWSAVLKAMSDALPPPSKDHDGGRPVVADPEREED